MACPLFSWVNYIPCEDNVCTAALTDLAPAQCGAGRELDLPAQVSGTCLSFCPCQRALLHLVCTAALSLLFYHVWLGFSFDLHPKQG